METGSGLKRQKLAMILAVAFLFFIAVGVLVFFLYKQGSNTIAAIVLMACPFFAYYFVAIWTMNTNRLARIQRHLVG